MWNLVAAWNASKCCCYQEVWEQPGKRTPITPLGRSFKEDHPTAIGDPV